MVGSHEAGILLGGHHELKVEGIIQESEVGKQAEVGDREASSGRSVIAAGEPQSFKSSNG